MSAHPASVVTRPWTVVPARITVSCGAASREQSGAGTTVASQRPPEVTSRRVFSGHDVSSTGPHGTANRPWAPVKVDGSAAGTKPPPDSDPV